MSVLGQVAIKRSRSVECFLYTGYCVVFLANSAECILNYGKEEDGGKFSHLQQLNLTNARIVPNDA
jgi:hypothetical protein